MKKENKVTRGEKLAFIWAVLVVCLIVFMVIAIWSDNYKLWLRVVGSLLVVTPIVTMIAGRELRKEEEANND